MAVIRNGTRSKPVLTEATGQVQIVLPRDWAGTFEPQDRLSTWLAEDRLSIL